MDPKDKIDYSERLDHLFITSVLYNSYTHGQTKHWLITASLQTSGRLFLPFPLPAVSQCGAGRTLA